MYLTAKSKVTRNSSNESTLRAECQRVASIGGAFEIKEYYGGDNWWTEFTIHTPRSSPDPRLAGRKESERG